LRFEADCVLTGTTLQTSGFVDVPAGTIVNGAVVAAGPVTALNANVTFPNQSTGVLNQVTATGRTAINITGGPGAGTMIGQVTCTPTSSQASALVGVASLTVNCGPNSPSQNVAGGTASNGTFTVGSPAGAQCDFLSGSLSRAKAAGVFSIAGVAYPLAVNPGNASGATPDLASAPASSDNGGPSTATLLVGGGLALALLAQITVGGKAWRRRGEATTG